MASRSSVPVTLADLFGVDRSRGLGGRSLAADDRARLTAALKLRPQVAVGDVEGELGHAYAGALGTRLIDIFLGAWSKLSEVAALGQSGRARPGERHLLPLARHTITSRHEPSVDVLLDDQPVLRVPLEVKLAAQFEAVVLSIEAGHVHAVRAGSFIATGAIACRGVPLASLSSQRFTMPAELTLTPPFPIARGATVAEPAVAPVAAAALVPVAAATSAAGIVLMGRDSEAQVVRLELQRRGGADTTWTIGRRAEKCDIALADRTVSGVHARVRATAAGAVVISDLGSSGGTYVDGRRIGSEEVRIDTARSVRLGGLELAVSRA